MLLVIQWIRRCADLEEEVSEGLLRREDTSNHCLLFRRTIDDLKNYSHLPAARRFADVSVREDGRPTIDPKCADMLHELVNSKIPRVLSPHNVISLSILWRHDDVVNEQYHGDYLAKVSSRQVVTVLLLFFLIKSKRVVVLSTFTTRHINCAQSTAVFNFNNIVDFHVKSRLRKSNKQTNKTLEGNLLSHTRSFVNLSNILLQFNIKCEQEGVQLSR